MALVDTEQITPLEEISKLYSSEASIIEKLVKNGSWDLKLILQMEGKIYDHKHRKINEIREAKRRVDSRFRTKVWADDEQYEYGNK